MKAVALLERLKSLGASVEAVGEKLRVTAPPGTLSAELRQALADEKPNLMALLRKADAPDLPPLATRSPRAPVELSYEERIDQGFVNPGWAPDAWRDRLLQLADRCEAVRPDLASDYRRWAANIRTTTK